MFGIRPKQMARIGQFYLEESILDILLEARHENQCLGSAEIGKRAGIYREGGGGGKGLKEITNMNDAIVTGFLNKLNSEEKVERCEQPNKRGGWKLTDDQFSARRDDVSIPD